MLVMCLAFILSNRVYPMPWLFYIKKGYFKPKKIVKINDKNLKSEFLRLSTLIIIFTRCPFRTNLV